MRKIRVKKAFSVLVWREVDINDTTSIENLQDLLEELEHDASLDLANIGQEVSYESSCVSLSGNEIEILK